MGVGGAQHVRVQRMWKRQIVDKAAVTGQQAMIFESHECPVMVSLEGDRV